MNQKVTALEQEIERLTDGAELENVSLVLTCCSSKILSSAVCLSHKHMWTSVVLCRWEEKSSTWNLSWRGRSARVPPMWQRSERWAETWLLHSHVTAFILLWHKNELCCVSYFMFMVCFSVLIFLWHPVYLRNMTSTQQTFSIIELKVHCTDWWFTVMQDPVLYLW